MASHSRSLVSLLSCGGQTDEQSRGRVESGAIQAETLLGVPTGNNLRNSSQNFRKPPYNIFTGSLNSNGQPYSSSYSMY